MTQAIRKVLDHERVEGRRRATWATSRVTTRPRRPGSGTRASAARTRRSTPRTRASSRVLGTFNSGCAAIDHPGAEPGARRRRGDGLACQHVRLPDERRARLCRRRAGQVLPVRHAQLHPHGRARRLPGRGRRRSTCRSRASTKLYVLNDKEAYGLGVADEPRNAAEQPRHRGRRLRGVGSEGRRATRASCGRSAVPVRTRVFLGGLIDENGAQVIKDKVAVLGAERRRRQAVHAGRLHDAGRRSTSRALRTRATPSSRSPASRRRSSRARRRVRRGVPGGPRRRADRPVRGLRRAGRAGPARRDRRVRLLTRRHRRVDVRRHGRGRLPRLVLVQRGRRPRARERRGCRLQHLPWCGGVRASRPSSPRTSELVEAARGT